MTSSQRPGGKQITAIYSVPSGQLTTPEMLRELHRMLTIELSRRLAEPGASAETLQVARKFLRDNGMLGAYLDDSDRRRLSRIYRLLVQRLRDAVTADQPAAAVLGEVRQFLRSQGIDKDLGGAISQAQALAALDLTSIPFKTQ